LLLINFISEYSENTDFWRDFNRERRYYIQLFHYEMRSGLEDNEAPDQETKMKYYSSIKLLDRAYALAKRVNEHGGGNLNREEKGEFIMLLEWLQENVTEH
jgi:hypothetical protein